MSQEEKKFNFMEYENAIERNTKNMNMKKKKIVSSDCHPQMKWINL